MNPEVKNLVSAIAKELNLKVSDVEKIYEAPFNLQAIIMKYRCNREELKFPSLRIPYFLIFYCPSWNKARLQKKKKDESV